MIPMKLQSILFPLKILNFSNLKKITIIIIIRCVSINN